MIKHHSLTKAEFIVHLRELPNLKLKPSPSRKHLNVLCDLFSCACVRVNGGLQ